MNDLDIEGLAIKVAASLDGFSADIHADRPVYLTRPDGARLVIRRPWRRPERLRIIAGYPSGKAAHDLPRHEITVAASRGAQTIAAEITRRLLPAYERDLATFRDRLAKTAAEDVKRAEFAQRLLTILPGASVHEDDRRSVIHWTAGNARGSISTHDDAATCHIEIDMAGQDLAERIARAAQPLNT